MLRPGTCTILNPRLVATLAAAGHTDLIVIADSGLPVPRTTEVIDLSLTPGVPSLAQVLSAVRDTLAIDAAVLARETHGRPVAADLERLLQGLPVEEVSHEELKRRLVGARAVIRTGECTPYANVGLVAGVGF